MAARWEGAGKKRRRVQVLQPQVGSPDSFGQEQTTATAGVTRWTSVEPLVGRELFTAMQVQADVSHRVRMRYGADLAGISPKWQIQEGSRIFEIVSILNLEERRREVEFLCVERNPKVV